jgi:type II secretory pathway component PulC
MSSWHDFICYYLFWFACSHMFDVWFVVKYFKVELEINFTKKNKKNSMFLRLKLKDQELKLTFHKKINKKKIIFS